MSASVGDENISIPGSSWRMLWTGQFNEFQLDIVGFLAILGEGSILSTAQISALSCLFYLPRLIPAPQALLQTKRPSALPSEPATVTAVYSGNIKEHIPHIAHVLLAREMPPFTVRCIVVKANKALQAKPVTRVDTLLRGQPAIARTSSNEHDPPLVKLRAYGPLAWVTLLGFFMSLALLIVSLVLGDGMSLIATLLLSALSTMVGISNKWELKLPRYSNCSANLPAGDVVIRFPNKSFLIVICEEEVARELFWAVEEIQYRVCNATAYRLISLVGTMMLMLGVIVLANAKLPLKFCWTGAYLVLNASHWSAAALPQRLHWDLSCFDIEEHGIAGGPANRTYMDALGKAITVTKNVEWLRHGQAVPFTQKWNEWLLEAEKAANTVGHRTGVIADRLWRTARSDNMGTVWDVPAKDVWTARSSWDKINCKPPESSSTADKYTGEPAVGPLRRSSTYDV